MRPSAPAAGNRYELHCTRCGYGVVARVAPERCPMCGASTWRHGRPRRRRSERPAA